MRLLRLLMAGFAVTAALSTADDASIQAQQSKVRSRQVVELPTESNFFRRMDHRVVVLGDYVYVDGGELSQVVNGVEPSRQFRAPNFLNATLSISLKTSWNLSGVAIGTIPKQFPGTRMAVVWTDPATSSFFLWGGSGSAFTSQPVPAIPTVYRFAGDADRGGGTWSLGPSEVATNALASGVLRTEKGAFARAGDTLFTLGGIATSFTEPGMAGGLVQPIPGLVSLNLTTNKWANVSVAAIDSPPAGAFSTYGTFLGGRLEYVPVFGSRGLLIPLGGGELKLQPWAFSPFSPTFFDFSSLKVYDIGQKKWHTQPATGEAPMPRRDFCSVGVRGPNGTYEIFVYGGAYDPNVANPTILDNVYILSLPGFFWTRAPSRGTGRVSHSCAVVGKRQMLSVGGSDRTHDSGGEWTNSKDPWPQGLGVFDMTELRWTDGFDAHAADYTPPRQVADWYSSGNLDNVSWASAEIKNIFILAQTGGGQKEPGSGGGPSDSNPADKVPGPDSDTSSESIPTQTIIAIVCGTVGGVVLAAAVCVGVGMLLRRRRRRRGTEAPASGSAQTQHVGTFAQFKDSSAELDGVEAKCELPQNPLAGGLYEADGAGPWTARSGP
ncbi:hypothetical protein RB595_007986 [Gaeumannomyces hyphopodioides]